jgi:hypothetical protein
MRARQVVTPAFFALVGVALLPGIAAHGELVSSTSAAGGRQAGAPAPEPRQTRSRAPARLRALAPLLVALVVMGACGDPGKAAAGIVISLEAPAGEVVGFTLRTQQGETIPFVIGTLEVDGAAFAASHLAEHAVTLQPIAVGYRVQDGVNVVHRMVDAPWAAPTP